MSKSKTIVNTLSDIRSIANELAWKNNTETITEWMGDAVTIYEEYLKGENYERIDVNNLGLKSISGLKNKPF